MNKVISSIYKDTHLFPSPFRWVLLASLLLMLQNSGSSGLYGQQKYWVTFTDKGNGQRATGMLSKRDPAFTEVMSILSYEAIQRRAKNLAPDVVIDALDVPLYQPYISSVLQTGALLVQQSRWLNAASFYLTAEQRQIVASYPFVAGIAPVKVLRGKIQSVSDIPNPGDSVRITRLNYGYSYKQVDLINAIRMHQVGIAGRGIRIGMLDSGFRWKTHEALQSRSIIGEYDFIFNDSVTSNQSADPVAQDGHGTYTLSALGGFKEGKLIGPAYDAQFLLAKTEYIPSETMIEEDLWTAGLEWLESRGAEIVTSSLGYNLFDDTVGYTWEHGDFDGKTSITAKAALRAARLGVLVCETMGNEGNGDGIQGTLLTPADADSILSVGAIDTYKTLATFSSTGPTNDGRIKPDLVALGTNVYCASPGQSTYTTMQGNSLSTPLVAGCAALVLSARPELTAMQVRDALRTTANKTVTSDFPASTVFPNNFLGYGLVDALQAALKFGPVFSNVPSVSLTGAETKISTCVISKFGIKADSVFLHYNQDGGSVFSTVLMQQDSSTYYPTSGLYSWSVPSTLRDKKIMFYIEARDSAGHVYTSPAPTLNTVWQNCCGLVNVWNGTVSPEAPALLQNYPNPFNSSTTVTVELRQCEQTEISIYTLTGSRIKTLFTGVLQPERIQLHWDGTNDAGEAVASGVYFVTVVTPSFTSSKTMVLVR